MIEAHEIGWFAGKLPREVGGTEATLVEQYEVIEALAHHDGSLGWNHTFMASSAGIAAARLPDEGVAEVQEPDGRWPRFSGTFPMTGVATPVPGGFRLSGRWGFASGIRIASWVACGATRADDATPLWLVLPVADVVVHDTWDSPGLAGTQSCDYSIDDCFVPASRTFTLTGPPRRGGPLFSMPIQAYLTPDHTGVTIGCARRALDECAAHAAGKQRLGSAQRLDQRGAFVRDLGRAHTQLAGAAAHVREVLARMDRAGVVDPTLFLDARCAATHAAEVAVGVATFAYRNGGAHAVSASSALGRAYRDTMTSSQHVHVLDDVFEWRGAELLR
jgi:alkylation response protein AidB-like acyl-CoA dehydrogenase